MRLVYVGIAVVGTAAVGTAAASRLPLGWVTVLNRVPACLAGVKAGRVHLCRVAGNTV